MQDADANSEDPESLEKWIEGLTQDDVSDVNSRDISYSLVEPSKHRGAVCWVAPSQPGHGSQVIYRQIWLHRTSLC